MSFNIFTEKFYHEHIHGISAKDELLYMFVHGAAGMEDIGSPSLTACLEHARLILAADRPVCHQIAGLLI